MLTLSNDSGYVSTGYLELEVAVRNLDTLIVLIQAVVKTCYLADKPLTSTLNYII